MRKKIAGVALNIKRDLILAARTKREHSFFGISVYSRDLWTLEQPEMNGKSGCV